MLALVDTLVADADSDADSYWADTADQAIADKLAHQDPHTELEAAESCQALDPTPAADNSDWAEKLAALACRKRAPVVGHMEMAPKWRLAVSELADWETLLEIADSIDCC